MESFDGIGGERPAGFAPRPTLLKYDALSVVKYDRSQPPLTMTISRRQLLWLYGASQWILLAGVALVAVLTSRAAEWQPLESSGCCWC